MTDEENYINPYQTKDCAGSFLCKLPHSPSDGVNENNNNLQVFGCERVRVHVRFSVALLIEIQ